MRGDWQADDRMTTLKSILEKKDDWSIDELKEVQTLAMNFENKDLSEKLLSELGVPNETWGKHAIKAYEILKDWDLVSSTEAVAPALYYTWVVELTKILLVDLTEEEKEMFFKAPNAWLFFKKILRNPESIWWNKVNKNEVVKKSFVAMLARLEDECGENIDQGKWGKIHTLTFNHPFGQIKPFDKIFNLGPYPVPSAYHEVANFKYFGLKDGFKVKAGPSTRRLIDFSNIEISYGILPLGNSGHLLSPFYKNQVSLFINDQYREQKLSLSKKETLMKLQMVPQ
jgi:penicillin amidase